MTGVTAVLAAMGSRIVNLPADISGTDTSGGLGAQWTFTLKRDGSYTLVLANGVGNLSGDWVAPKYSTVGDLYDFALDWGATAPDAQAAGDNTYIQGNSDRVWGSGIAHGAPSETCTGTIRIRRRSDSSETYPAGDTCTFTFTING